MSLTPNQQRFVEKYLIDLNATQAAIRAGYSARSARSVGHENLPKPDIASAIQEGRIRLSERVEIGQDRIIEELAKIGFANMKDFLGILLDSNPAYHLLRLSPDQTAALSEVVVEQNRIKFKLHDKRAALVDIGKHLGMFSGNVRDYNLQPVVVATTTICEDMSVKDAAEAYSQTLLAE